MPRRAQPFVPQPVAYQDTDYIEDYEDCELGPSQGRTESREQYQDQISAPYYDQRYQPQSDDYPAVQSNLRQTQSVSYNQTQNNGFGL